MDVVSIAATKGVHHHFEPRGHGVSHRHGAALERDEGFMEMTAQRKSPGFPFSLPL